MRTRPKPWGLDLWDKVEAFLEDCEDVDFDDANRHEMGERAHELLKMMKAENAIRAKENRVV